MLRKTHKGPRLLVNVHLSNEVVRLIDQDVRRCAASSRSQLLADRLSARYGRGDLVRELDREQLELVLPPNEPADHAPTSHDEAAASGEQEVAFRVPREVVTLIDRDAQRSGRLARRQYLARVLTKLYSPWVSPDPDREEQLELAVPTRHEPAA